MIKYSNTDCLGNELTYSTPASHQIKLSESNCLTFNANNTNYVYFGKGQDLFHDTTKVVFKWLSPSSITSNRTLFTGLTKVFNENTGLAQLIYKISTDTPIFQIGYINSSPSATTNYSTGTLYSANYTVSPNTIYEISVDLSDPSNPILIINGETLTVTATTNSTAYYWPYHSIGIQLGAYRPEPGRVEAMSAAQGSMWNIRLYDENDNLVHHYPLSEGYGINIYDTVGDVHGYLSTPNMETSWMSVRQDDYHYNLENGFYRIEADKDKIVGVGKQYDTSASIHGNLINRYQKYIRIPKQNLLDGNKILIMRSCFDDRCKTTTYHTPKNLNTTDVSAAEITKIIDTVDGSTYVNVVIPEHKSTAVMERYVTCGIHLLPGFEALGAQAYNVLYPQPAGEYVAKFKVRLNSYKLTGEEATPYYCSLGIFSLGNNEAVQMLYSGSALIKGEWIEVTANSYDLSNNKKSTHNLSYRTPWFGLRGCVNHSTLGTTTHVPNGTEGISADYDIKDVKIYKVGNYNYYEPIENGYNQTENKIVIDKDNNIAELNNVVASYLPDDWNLICDARSFGQNYYYKWNITSTVTSAITNYIVRAGPRVMYLKCIDSGLPDDVQTTWAYPRGISFTTNNMMPNTNAMNFIAISYPLIKQYQGKIQNNTLDYNLLEFKARVHFYYRKNTEEARAFIAAGCYQNASQYDRGRTIFHIPTEKSEEYEVGKWYEFDEIVDLMYAGANSQYQYIGFCGELKSGSTYAEGAWSLCDLWIEIVGAPQNIDVELIQDDKGRIKGMKNILIHNQNPLSTLSHKRLQLKTKF